MSSAPPRAAIPKLTDLNLELETPRLKLRPWTTDDVDAMWKCASQPEFPKHMSWAAHADKTVTRSYIESTREDLDKCEGVVWAMIHEAAIVGSIGLESITWQLAAWRVDRAELGYWIAPELWGKGLMTEAVRHVLVFGYSELGLHKVTTGCLEQNVGSRRVIEKNGFKFIGRREEDVWRDGAWHTHLRYELTAAQWSDGAG